MKLTRILYCSDLHGSESFYRKFLSAANQYKANVLIVGGDVTGKAMVPVVRQNNSHYVGFLFGRKEEAETAQELEKVKKSISAVGFYPIVIDQDEADAMEKDPSLMSARFEEEMIKRVKEWMILAEEKMKPAGMQMFFMPGNDDLHSIDPVIDQFTSVHNPDMRCFKIDDEHEIVGCSYANMTPWRCVRDLEEDDLKIKMDELEKLVQHPERTVAVLHVPPYNSGLDSCPDLDKDLKIRTQGGQVLLKAAGSPAVSEFIKRVQPMLSLHGHIHESPGHIHIGRTLAVNAGSEYAEGIMKAAIINLEGDKVKGHLLVSG